MVRAPRWHRGGCRFEPDQVHQIKNMNEREKPELFNFSDAFVSMSPSEFRDFLDNHWRQTSNAKVTIEVSESSLSESKKNLSIG